MPATAATQLQLARFPEELLERILVDAVVSTPTPHFRPSWHPHSKEKETRSRLAPLLVCRAFHRIALPLFYNTLVLHSPSQSQALLAVLQDRPLLVRFVRALVLPAPGPADAEIMRLLAGKETKLCSLDITLPDSETEGLTDALRSLHSLRELCVRKSAGTYLSQPAPRDTLEALADVVSSCPLLETTTLSFPLSADPSLTPLVYALSAAPALHTLRSPLPSFWSPSLLTVSANPALVRICLGERPIMGTSLFLSVARTHTHLSELIRAGTTVLSWRPRAWTVGSADAGAHAPLTLERC